MGEKTKICFHINNFCNLNCKYCYQQNKGHKELDIEKAKFFLDRFFERDTNYFKNYFTNEIHGIILDFIGGEATLSITIVNEITDYFYQKCIDYGKVDWIINSDIWLETNGTTYFEPEVYRYIQKHAEKLELPITLDGNKELHDKCRLYYDGKGSYDDVERAVIHYRDTYGKMPNSKLTLSPENVSFFFDGILNFIRLGYTSVRCSCQAEDVWDEKSENEYYRQLIKIYDYIIENKINFVFSPMRDFTKKCTSSTCGIYGSMICIDYDGNIYNCFRYADVSIPNRESMKLGTVDAGITNLKTLQKLRDRVTKTIDPQCQKCTLSSSCEQCPAFNYQHAGSMTKNLKTNCRINHIEAKAFKYFQQRCNEEGFNHPMISRPNEWNEHLFECNGLKSVPYLDLQKNI